MYHVIHVYQDFEPWWFFPEWTENIQSSESFEELDQAKVAFAEQVEAMSQTYDKQINHQEGVVAFYDEGDLAFCEDCDDDLQMYHGLILFDEENPPEIKFI